MRQDRMVRAEKNEELFERAVSGQAQGTVVCVNDDPTVLKMIARVLTNDEWNVYAFTRAEAALEHMRTKSLPDVVVTDLHMPEIDGWRFCRLMRGPESGLPAKIPIVVVSATYSGADAREVTSKLGASAFVNIPFDCDYLCEQVRAAANGRIQNVRPRVLVVEDNELLLDFVKKAFFKRGYEAKTATTGEEGMKVLDDFAPEIVVTDYHLPGKLQGDDILRAAVAGKPAPAVIVMTTDPSTELATRLMRMGAAAYISKPFDPEYLIEVCANVAREHALLEVERLLETRTRELKISENKYRTMLENAGEGIALIRDEKCIYVNPSLCALLGYKRQGVLEKNIVGFIHPDDRAIALSRHRAMLAGEEVPTHYQIRLTAADGSTKCFEVSAKVVDWENAPTTLAMLTDVTERMHSENLRRQIEEELRRSEKMRAVGQLAAGVAHEFNNLLQGIVGNADLLREECAGSASACRRADRIVEISRRAASMVRHLLDFARKGKYSEAAVDANALVKNVVEVIGYGIDPRIRVTTEFGIEPALVVGYPPQIENTIMNLALNARDAVSDGGTITIRTSRESVAEQKRLPYDFIAEPGEYICVSVADNGCGIALAHIDRIFEPFFSGKGVGKGAGLGLSSVYGCVKNHGGFVTVTSRPGGGAVFDVFFPAAGASSKPVEQNGARGMHGEYGIRVLVADDNECVLDATVDMLVELGCKVERCVNGRVAVEKFRANPNCADLAILDMLMPELDGAGAFEEIRALNPTVPVILASGYGIEEDLRRMSNAVAIGALQKPFSIGQLEAKIEELLGRAPRPSPPAD